MGASKVIRRLDKLDVEGFATMMEQMIVDYLQQNGWVKRLTDFGNLQLWHLIYDHKIYAVSFKTALLIQYEIEEMMYGQETQN